MTSTAWIDGAQARRPLGYGAYLTAFPDGRLCNLRFPGDRDQIRNTKREAVRGFSRGSRRRLLETLHKVRRDAFLPWFVTLTFPDLFPTMDGARSKLTAWLKRLKRAFPEASAVWRLEVIDRKSGASKGQVAPHFHLMIWGCSDEKWMAVAWWEVNGKSGYAHLAHGCDSQQIESWRGVASYVGKYMAKDSEHESAGRVWGVHNRLRLPLAKPVVTRVCVRVAFRIRRTIRRLMHSRGRRGKTAWASSVFTESPCGIESLIAFFSP